jgi:N-glycosidase YbiA
MRTALRAKFKQHPELKKTLLSTGEARLIESSPTDSYWGIATREDGSEGFNKLGLLLMEIREEIRGENKSNARSLLD